VNKPNYKFTKEMVIERFINMVHTQPEQAKQLGKPNLIQLMRAKRELDNKGKQWPLV